MKDAEAALLEASPTMSTISSDCTEQTYVDSSTPDSPMIIKPMFNGKCLDDEELMPVVVLGRGAPRKPTFRLRPPYLMIFISIVEVSYA